MKGKRQKKTGMRSVTREEKRRMQGQKEEGKTLAGKKEIT
jgi:hypothetical protein